MPLTLSGTNGVSGVDGTASMPAAQGSDANTGVFYPAADTVGLATNGTERARISSDGTFRVKGAGTAGSTDAVQFSGSAPASAMTLDASGNLGIGLGATAAASRLNVNGSLYLEASSVYKVRYQSGSNIYSGNFGPFWLQLGNNGNNDFVAGSGATGGYFRWYVNNTTDLLTQTNNGTLAMTLDANGKLTVPAIYTNTAGSANVSVDANGLLTRITSSIKYKKDVVTYNDGLNKVLGLRPVTYKSKCELDENTLYGGFIAEEVAESGLEEFIERNTDGEVEAVRYPNMVALMAAAIQELSAKLDAAEARIAALEAK